MRRRSRSWLSADWNVCLHVTSRWLKAISQLLRLRGVAGRRLVLSLLRRRAGFLSPVRRWLCHVCLIMRCWRRKAGCCGDGEEEEEWGMTRCSDRALGADFMVGEVSFLCRECPVMSGLRQWWGEVLVEICVLSHTHTPTSPSLQIDWTQPVISVKWVCGIGWHTFPRWRRSANKQVNEMESHLERGSSSPSFISCRCSSVSGSPLLLQLGQLLHVAWVAPSLYRRGQDCDGNLDFYPVILNTYLFLSSELKRQSYFLCFFFIKTD